MDKRNTHVIKISTIFKLKIGLWNFW